MGTWDASIKGNDTTTDVYDQFMDRYGSGMKPTEISSEIMKDFAEYFTDRDDRNNALMGLALAQWETASLDPNVFSEVKKIIDTGEDLVLWRELEASEADIKQRKKALEKFLQQISVPREKPKRRQKRGFDYKQIEIVRAVAPDNKKQIRISEGYVNGKYDDTHGMMEWAGAGSGILGYRNQNKNISAHWKDSQTLIITHDRNINFTHKDEKFFYCGDSGVIEYVPVDWLPGTGIGPL